MTKVCTKCGEEKALEEFSKASSKKDGRQSHCKDCVKAYNHANKEYYREYQREYYQSNKECFREYDKERYASDPLYALKRRCSTRIRHALKGHGFSKAAATKDMLGCTYEELMRYIESQFVDGMTWENRSDWHIDHIVPLASAQTEEELLALSHYTNLQPLWADDNMSKGARLDWAA